jgi:hypothetical protein
MEFVERLRLQGLGNVELTFEIGRTSPRRSGFRCPRRRSSRRPANLLDSRSVTSRRGTA